MVEEHYDTFATFQRQCQYITRTLLDRISNALGMKGDRSLNHFHRSDCPSKSACAFLHYIPMDPSGQNVGHGMHTDYGTLTLVFAPQWGLQVLRPSSPGSDELDWHFVEPRPGFAVVNVADVLSFLTKRRFKSAVHRVIPLPDQHRYSVTYFLRPSDEVEFVDDAGKLTHVLDWYDRKNNNYETPSQKQDRSLLIGGLYKGSFEPEDVQA